MLPKDKVELLNYLIDTTKKNLEDGILTEEQLYACLTQIQRAEYDHMVIEAGANFQTREL